MGWMRRSYRWRRHLARILVSCTWWIGHGGYALHRHHGVSGWAINVTLMGGGGGDGWSGERHAACATFAACERVRRAGCRSWAALSKWRY